MAYIGSKNPAVTGRFAGSSNPAVTGGSTSSEIAETVISDLSVDVSNSSPIISTIYTYYYGQ